MVSYFVKVEIVSGIVAYHLMGGEGGDVECNKSMFAPFSSSF
jgi:hypothetical protein